MRRRSTEPAMSLFPFLDTLVCTMGALILMLLAMTPKIKERAQARMQAQLAAVAPTVPDEPEPEPTPEPEPAPEPVAIVAAPEMNNRRAQAAEDLEAERKRRRDAWFKSAAEARETLLAKQADYRKRRQVLKEADQRLKDLQDQILKIRLKSEAVGEADQSLAETAAQLEVQQEKISQEIAKTRKSIDVLNRRQASAKNEYSLVPYDGTSGTTRRPIYIECTDRGFRFLPEDETVSPADLAGFAENYNPLLAGTQSLVDFWTRRRRNSPESEPQPYVLLLVRPSGCLTYWKARELLSSSGVNFGYELIEEDWKLSLPDADPKAKSLLRDTLDATVQGRRPLKNVLADSGRAGGASREFARGDRASPFGSDDDGDNWGDFENAGGGGGRSGGGRGSGRGAGRQPSIKLGPATRASRNGAGAPADDDPLADADGVGGTGTAGSGKGTGAAGAGTGTGARTGTGTGVENAAGGGTGGGTGSGRGRGGARAAGISGGSRFGSGDGDGGSDGEGGAFSSGVGTGMASRGSAGGSSGRFGTAGNDSTGEFGSFSLENPSGSTGFGSGKGINDGTGTNGNGTNDDTGGSSTPGSLFGTSGRGGRAGRGSSSRLATLGGSGSLFGGDGGSGNGGSGDGEQPPELMAPFSTDNSFGGEGGDGSGGPGRTKLDPTLSPFSPNSRNAMNQSPFNLSGGNSSLASGSSSGSSRAGSSTSSSSGSPSSSGATSSDSSASDSQGSGGSQGPSGGSVQGDPTTPGSSSGGSTSSLQFGGPGASVSLGGSKKAKPKSKDDDPDSGPRVPQDDGQAGGRLGRSNGPRKWGQVGKKASIGFEKRIEIRLMSDRILVGSKDGSIPVKRSDSHDEIVGRVVNAIDYAADKWGQPPPNCYWVPAVRFVVYPGGDLYYEKLSKVLEQKYGVNSTVDYADDKPVKKSTSGGRP